MQRSVYLDNMRTIIYQAIKDANHWLYFTAKVAPISMGGIAFYRMDSTLFVLEFGQRNFQYIEKMYIIVLKMPFTCTL